MTPFNIAANASQNQNAFQKRMRILQNKIEMRCKKREEKFFVRSARIRTFYKSFLSTLAYHNHHYRNEYFSIMVYTRRLDRMRKFIFLVAAFCLSCDVTAHHASAAVTTTELSASVYVVEPSAQRYRTPRSTSSATNPISAWQNISPPPAPVPISEPQGSFGYTGTQDSPSK
jgi:hypothetical protein